MTTEGRRRMVGYARKLLAARAGWAAAERAAEDAVHDAVVNRLRRGEEVDEGPRMAGAVRFAAMRTAEVELHVVETRVGVQRRAKDRAYQGARRRVTDTWPCQIFGCMLSEVAP